MKHGSSFFIPETITQIAQAIRQAKGRALLVGGGVRDALLGDTPKDWDMEVFGLSPEVLESILAQWEIPRWVGKSFGVFKLTNINLDVSLPRVDHKTSEGGHRGFAVAVDPSMSFEEAARRRDLTINSMGYDPLTHEILDPFKGRDDLHRRVLRATDATRFAEDPLRGLRVAQMAARFLMTPDPALVTLCRGLSLHTLSKERFWGEFEKLLLKGIAPSRGLAFLREAHLLSFFPELERLIDVPQDPIYHPEGDVWTHTLMVVDAAVIRREGLSKEEAIVLMFGALCHDFGKPYVTQEKEGRIRALQHDEAGIEPTHAFLARLTAHRELVRKVATLVRWHLAPFRYERGVEKERASEGAQQKHDSARLGAYRRLARILQTGGVSMALLWRLAWADHRGRFPTVSRRTDVCALRTFRQKARLSGVWHAPLPEVVTGEFLMKQGIEPGPEMGKLLALCCEVQDQEGASSAEYIFKVACARLKEHVS